MKKVQQQHNPFINQILDDEEQAIEKALERGEYEEDPHFEETKQMLKEAIGFN